MWRPLIVVLFVTACGGVGAEPLDPEPAGDSSSHAPIASAPGAVNEAAGFCPQRPYPASPLPENAVPTAVCPGLRRTDGPVWDANLGRLFFSNYDVPSSGGFPGGIMEYEPLVGCRSFASNAAAKGLALANGKLLAALHEARTIVSVDTLTGALENVLSCYQGHAFNSTNDVSVSMGGAIYFTDPAFGAESIPEALYYRRAGQGLRAVVLAARHPKGVALAPDERKVYVSVEEPDEVLVFDVNDQGMLEQQRRFVAERGSGLTVDCAGNVYLATADGVRVYGADGAAIGGLHADSEVTNVAFGGPLHRTLYITTQGALLSLELRIAGPPS